MAVIRGQERLAEALEFVREQGELLQQKARTLILSPKHSQEINRSIGSLLQSWY